eukprot:9495527-Pyramimonas_sp.AAC.4
MVHTPTAGDTVRTHTTTCSTESDQEVTKRKPVFNLGNLRPDVMVLGIESSCDETAAAVVTADGRILGESLASQAAIHAPWGGGVPKLAQGAHEEAIDGIVEKALADAGAAFLP